MPVRSGSAGQPPADPNARKAPPESNRCQGRYTANSRAAVDAVLLKVNAQHLALLTASGIPPRFAAARGYETITDPTRLAELPIWTGETVAIVKPGRRAPGLLIPQLGVDTEIHGYLYRADDPRFNDSDRAIKYESVYQRPPVLDVPPSVAELLADPAVVLWITEGSRKADAAAARGLCCVSIAGVWGWLAKNSAGASQPIPELREIPWKGDSGRRTVVLAFDGDVTRKQEVRAALQELARTLAYKGARVQYLHLPDTEPKTGLDDYLAEHPVDELWELVKAGPPPVAGADDAAPDAATAAPAAPEPTRPVQPISLAEAHTVSKKWLGDDYDGDALDLSLITVAVERLDGDPLWALIVSGSGAAKTETVRSMVGAGAIVISTLTSDAALLSATSEHDRAKDATGGLLPWINSQPVHVLVIKDVTSILSMNRDLRGRLLAALREIHDGSWRREIGTDGGRFIEWRGRALVLGAVTTAWDTHHAVIGQMGDRFVLLRVDSDDAKTRRQAARRAIRNTGREAAMHAALAAAAGGVIAGMNHTTIELPDALVEVIADAADLTTRARTAVEQDYRGDVIDAHAPEMPTRFPKQLAQIVRGGVAIGMELEAAVRLALRCARDSIPPLRLAIIEDLAANPYSTPTDVRKRLQKPRATVDRQLQALHALGLVELDEVKVPGPFGGKAATEWHYSLDDAVTPDVISAGRPLPDMSLNTPIPHRRSEKSEGSDENSDEAVWGEGTDTSGNGRPAETRRNGVDRVVCSDGCGRPPSPGLDRCAECHRIHVAVITGYDQ
jgi:hypothetical protein